ncbi:sigma-70 family RNA polymerase sigma factor [Pontibacter qinzhouensis]|uniref:Sigma-70 family RNA polymerase sigma factor n=1 Tax=Pontibacter qinzhouensis TaxID=2603253 RepID=A0A5C8KEN5_9BACT|nr:sigma-70 family RNA polymerase sigma factor [Pontibacter qinzhouensis]TXK52853.1 sigma-70 family RNA polymerase sigma factor [Pontibacter qinzhouensis]
MQTLEQPVIATDIREDLVQHREKTLEKLYAKAYPMVLHYVKQQHGSPDDAKDLLQDAIILFYEKVVHQKLTLTAAPTTYLMAVCKNRWRHELEKRNRQQELSPEVGEQLQEESALEAPAFALAAFVDKLGEKCRATLVAFYYLGQQLEQIAQQHQYRNVRSATVQKFKCLERLRKSLQGFSIHHFR